MLPELLYIYIYIYIHRPAPSFWLRGWLKTGLKVLEPHHGPWGWLSKIGVSKTTLKSLGGGSTILVWPRGGLELPTPEGRKKKKEKGLGLTLGVAEPLPRTMGLVWPPLGQTTVVWPPPRDRERKKKLEFGNWGWLNHRLGQNRVACRPLIIIIFLT
jgi:hypothetical protein